MCIGSPLEMSVDAVRAGDVDHTVSDRLNRAGIGTVRRIQIHLSTTPYQQRSTSTMAQQQPEDLWLFGYG